MTVSAGQREHASMGPDLTTCEREPIHIPGAIQPHGALLVLAEDEDLRVTQASDNVRGHLGLDLERVLGHTLAEVLGAPAANLVASALSAPDLDQVNPVQLATRGRRLEGVLHRHDGATIIELEPAAHDAGDGAPLRLALSGLQRATTLAELSKLLVAEVRRLTGFERVMLYRFDEHGHGSVDAEARVAELEPYLGLHYPASDIPQQARRLYTLNWLRSIPDARYTPAQLVPTLRPDTGRPLDLARSTLRSVSPIHLEYLANMGIRASFSVSLVVRDRLWGLISCANHSGPRHLRHELRSACETLGRLASIQLTALQDREASMRRAARRGPLDRLAAAVRERSEEEVLVGLLSRGPELLALVGAEGVAVTGAGRTAAFGRVPDERTLEAILRWPDARGEAAAFATATLPAEVDAALEAKDVASGLLTFALPGEPRRRLTWFRPELARTVTWGGDPRKPVVVDPSTRLHPRRSFAAWREEVRLRSRPWTDCDLDAADDLRRIVVELDLERQVSLARRAVRARDDLVAVVSHDLRSPLNLIQLQASRLTSGRLGEQEPSPRLRASAAGILRAVDHMSALIHDLLDLAKIEAGRFAVRPRAEDLGGMVEEAFVTFGPLADARHITLRRLPFEPTSVHADRDRVFQVLSNLLSNAIKFTPEGGSVRVSVERRGSEVVLSVADSGPGIDPAALAHIFDRYWQAPGRQRRDGSGLGLFIARGIVEAHGGRIWAESVPGQGSTFRLTLSAL